MSPGHPDLALNVSWQMYCNKLDHTQLYRTQWDAHLHASVLMTSTPGNWSFGSHCCAMTSPLWPSVLLWTGQLLPCWYWPGYKGFIQGRHTEASAVLVCCLTYALMFRLNISTYKTQGSIIQLLPLCEGNMTVCSPEAGNIARGVI